MGGFLCILVDMRAFILTLLVLAVVAGAETFQFSVSETVDRCRYIRYDTFTHEFEPSDCTVLMECSTLLEKYGGYAKVRIYKKPGEPLEVRISQLPPKQNIYLSAADFSMMLANGAFVACWKSTQVYVDPVRPK